MSRESDPNNVAPPHDSILFHDHQGDTIEILEILETLPNGQERVLQTRSGVVRPIIVLDTDEALQ